MGVQTNTQFEWIFYFEHGFYASNVMLQNQHLAAVMQIAIHLIRCVVMSDLKSDAAANALCNATSSSMFHCSYVKDTVNSRAFQVLCFKNTLAFIWKFTLTCILNGLYF